VKKYNETYLTITFIYDIVTWHVTNYTYGKK